MLTLSTILKVCSRHMSAPTKPKRLRKRFIPSDARQPLEVRVLLSAAVPYKIPLELVDVSKPGAAEVEHKLGIYVGIGGGEPKLYEFDTGGEGFWASYNPNLQGDQQWWGAYQVEGRRNLNISYSSGNSYLANMVSTSVQLYREADDGEGFVQVVGTTEDVDLGQIVRYLNPGKPRDVRMWNNALGAGDPPLGGVFYGDFGASLSPIGTNPGNTIYSILPQIPMPEGLVPGFLVHVGEPGGEAAPYLQLGLTEADLASSETTLRMNPYEGAYGTTFPITHLPTYSQRVTTANFTWTNPQTGHGQRFTDVGWTIDTGALPVNVWQGNQLRVHPAFLRRPSRVQGFHLGAFKDNLTFTVDAAAIGGPEHNLLLVIPRTGRTPGVNAVSATYHGRSNASLGRNYVNTGMLTFTKHDVFYNLERGTIHFRRPTEWRF